MKKLPTPRTAAHQMIDGMAHDQLWRNFAETLERELQQANDYADRLVEHKDMVCLPADLANLREANAHFAAENEALKKQRDRLAEALQSLRSCIQDTRGNDAYEAVKNADEALQSLTPNEL